MDNPPKREVPEHLKKQFQTDIDSKYPKASLEEKQVLIQQRCDNYLEGRAEGEEMGRADAEAEVEFLYSLGTEDAKLALARHLANLKDVMSNPTEVDFAEYELFLETLLATAFVHGAYIKSKLDAGTTQKEDLIRLLQRF
jgi:hypothetical protein